MAAAARRSSVEWTWERVLDDLLGEAVAAEPASTDLAGPPKPAVPAAATPGCGRLPQH